MKDQLGQGSWRRRPERAPVEKHNIISPKTFFKAFRKLTLRSEGVWNTSTYAAGTCGRGVHTSFWTSIHGGDSVGKFGVANKKGPLELTNAAIVLGCDKSNNGEDLIHVLPCHFLGDAPHEALQIMKQWAERNFIHLNTCIELDATEVLPTETWHAIHPSSRKFQDPQPIKYAWLLPSSKRIVPARNVHLHTSNPQSEDGTLRLEHYRFTNLMTQCHRYGQGLKYESEERFWDAVSAVLRINESRNGAERELARIDLQRATGKMLDEWDSARFRINRKTCAGTTVYTVELKALARLEVWVTRMEAREVGGYIKVNNFELLLARIKEDGENAMRKYETVLMKSADKQRLEKQIKEEEMCQELEQARLESGGKDDETRS
ncbi:uncharacterized protein PAC_07830 [Phialocephala subalpina]|uniref:Uncharacterized protein n=1 Tax=Phialocephala subalpina TaxID=576137 RepID=A0A1L7WYX4_9HELO|nr:uncharacterized protein PAC_07830 [Phialocephala subalpina]